MLTLLLKALQMLKYEFWRQNCGLCKRSWINYHVNIIRRYFKKICHCPYWSAKGDRAVIEQPHSNTTESGNTFLYFKIIIMLPVLIFFKSSSTRVRSTGELSGVWLAIKYELKTWFVKSNLWDLKCCRYAIFDILFSFSVASSSSCIMCKIRLDDWCVIDVWLMRHGDSSLIHF